MKFILVALVALTGACSADKAPSTTKLVTMCRDDNNSITVESLYKEGWKYVGQLHNNGINCTVTLWHK